jgi:hypothetical protein
VPDRLDQPIDVAKRRRRPEGLIIPSSYPSCSSSSDCSSSPFGNTCGTIDVNNVLHQTCGSATGALWTYATLCGIPNNSKTYGPVDCYASNGQGSELGDLFACANLSGTDASAADSCYTTPGPSCCGCPEYFPTGPPISHEMTPLPVSVRTDSLADDAVCCKLFSASKLDQLITATGD